MTKSLPRYPIYVPSKGRADACLTANFLLRDGVPFHLVIEPQEYDKYVAHYDPSLILILPFSDLGSVIPARNWIKDHAAAAGHKRHWQIDDNIRKTYRMWRGKRIPCDSSVAFRVVEDLTDRYTNVAISGLNYAMWIGLSPHKEPPFHLNCRVYSCSLILNSIPFKWRGTYNEDVDICLQVLAAGWCTILVNAFLAHKARTMTMKGGNTDEIYQGDGRLIMARSIERRWPYVVKTARRYGRPQHVVKDAWRRFDTKLIPSPDFDPDNVQPNDYGLKLIEVAPVKSPDLRALQDIANATLSSSEDTDA